jgi:hypothetical protein
MIRFQPPLQLSQQDIVMSGEVALQLVALCHIQLWPPAAPRRQGLAIAGLAPTPHHPLEPAKAHAKDLG